MKEEEAKLKWCPHVRVAAFVGNTHHAEHASVNRGEHLHAGINCIGSACMMWDMYMKRESINLDVGLTPKGEGWEKISSHLKEALWVRWVDTDSGDCGLKSKDMECGA